MHWSISNPTLGIAGWTALGIVVVLFSFSIGIFVIGYRDRRLPIEMRNVGLDKKIGRIGLLMKILGAATVAILGIMNIFGWKF